MTFLTKKGHFNVHKTAPSLVTLARFLSRMITLSQGTGAINTALNMTRLVVIQFVQGVREGRGGLGWGGVGWLGGLSLTHSSDIRLPDSLYSEEAHVPLYYFQPS